MKKCPGQVFQNVLLLLPDFLQTIHHSNQAHVVLVILDPSCGTLAQAFKLVLVIEEGAASLQQRRVEQRPGLENREILAVAGNTEEHLGHLQQGEQLRLGIRHAREASGQQLRS